MTTEEQLRTQVHLLELSQSALLHEVERLKKLSKSRLTRLKRAQKKIDIILMIKRKAA